MRVPAAWWGLLAISLACSPEGLSPKTAPEEAPLERRVPAVALQIPRRVPGPALQIPRRVPGPAPQTRPSGFDAIAENAACAGCHPAIAAEWSASAHRRSWDDELFLSAYAIEPRPFCRRCHAPEGDEDPRARHLGVGCVTCHVLGEAVIGSDDRVGPSHRVVGDAAIRTAAWCGSCHEFDFPRPQAALMQSTLSEHRRSLHRDEACQHCHMPPAGVEPHRSHRFAISPLLPGALAARARLRDERTVEITLRVTGAGHAVPTGDLFRRLVVRARSGDHDARPRVLARVFRKAPTAHGPERLQVGDDRLAPDGSPTVVSLFFLRPIEEPVDWEVAYQRMGPHEAAVFGIDLRDDETIVASGRLDEP